MPRITSKRKAYMTKDIGSWIAGKMRMNKITQADMADCLNITQQAFGQKLRKSQFTYADLLAILEKLNVTDEEIIKLMRA